MILIKFIKIRVYVTAYSSEPYVMLHYMFGSANQ
jgi:hypothetical protein